MTGGPTRQKLTPQELEAKMAAAKANNAAILRRREEVDKDKESYTAVTAEERMAREERAKKAVNEKKLQVS